MINNGLNLQRVPLNRFYKHYIIYKYYLCYLPHSLRGQNNQVYIRPLTGRIHSHMRNTRLNLRLNTPYRGDYRIPYTYNQDYQEKFQLDTLQPKRSQINTYKEEQKYHMLNNWKLILNRSNIPDRPYIYYFRYSYRIHQDKYLLNINLSVNSQFPNMMYNQLKFLHYRSNIRSNITDNHSMEFLLSTIQQGMKVDIDYPLKSTQYRMSDRSKLSLHRLSNYLCIYHMNLCCHFTKIRPHKMRHMYQLGRNNIPRHRLDMPHFHLPYMLHMNYDNLCNSYNLQLHPFQRKGKFLQGRWLNRHFH